jgi:predicted phosphodiesterase
LQPGTRGTLDATDELKIIWVTDATPGNYQLEYRAKNGATSTTATPAVTALNFATPPAKAPAKPEPDQHYLRYTATVKGLPLDTEFTYTVKLGTQVVAQNTAHTRASSHQPVRFVMVGDLANGKSDQYAIAYHIHETNPQFMVMLGDIVYPSGRAYHYMKYFWNTYNETKEPSEKLGAAMMGQIPFYAVLGNHDTTVGKLSPTLPDAYSVFYFFSAPLNGPGEGIWSTPVPKTEQGDKFRQDAGKNYPALTHYSFDNGPAHIVVISNGGGGTPDDPAVAAWLEKDLKASHQPWKFVCMHVPMFEITPQHYGEQKLRRFAPIFEANGVDVVFAGHVHNYQRSKPLTFAPTPGAAPLKAGVPLELPKEKDKEADKAPKDEHEPKDAHKENPNYVNGVFTIDEKFDGEKNTKAHGILYIVSGGGGATLYKGSIEKILSKLPVEVKDNYAPFNAKYVDGIHSFSLINLSEKRLELHQIDQQGHQIDQVVIEK